MKKNTPKKRLSVSRKTADKGNKDEFVNAIEKIGVHDHLCLIYNNKKEQFAAVIPFMRTGLERGEKCVYIVDDNIAKEVIDAMHLGGIDVGAALKKGSLSIISKKDAYLKNGYFDPDEMIAFLKESTDAAKKEGYVALRATGEMTWMLGNEKGNERLLEYEAKLNRFFPKNDALAICQYNHRRFPEEILLGVIQTHPRVVVGNTVCKNFYYIPVEEFLKKGGETFEKVDRLLKNLLDRENAEIVQTRLEQENIRVSRALRMVNEINHALIHITDEQVLLNKVCQIVVEIGGYRLAWIGFAESNKEKSIRSVAHAGFELGYIESLKLTWADTIRGRGPTGTAIRTRKVSIARDIATDPLMEPWREDALKRGYHSSIALPLIINSDVSGVFTIYSGESNAFIPREVEILKELADELSFGIVTGRTRIERKSLEEKFKIIFDNTNDGIILVESESKKFILGNKTICQMLGYSPEEIKTLTIANIHPRESLHNVMEQFRKQMKGEIKIARDLPVKRKNGSIFYADINTSRVTIGGIVYGLGVFRDITERKRSIEELTKLKKAVETSGEAIYTTDYEGIIAFVNPEFTDLYGYTPAEVVGKKTPRILKSGLRSSKEYAAFWNELRAGKIIRSDHVNKTKDGRFLTIRSSASPIFDDNKKIVGFLAIQHDITEQEKVEEKYRHIIQTTNEGIWVIDKNHRLTFVNPQTLRMLGYAEEEVLGRKMDEFIAPEEFKEHEYQMQERQKGKAGSYERRFLQKSGAIIWCNVSAAPMFDNRRKFIGSFGMLTDITERKKADKLISEASQYTRSLIEASLDPLVTISADGKITDVNKATEVVTGYSRDKLIQKEFSDYFANPEKAREGYQKVFREGAVHDYPLEIRHKDGHITPVLYNASVYKDKEGNVLGVFAAARDITERKKAELEREQYFKFFNLSTDIMVIADPNGNFKKVNPMCLSELGYSEAELISKPFIDFVHPDDKQSTLDEMAKQIKTGSSLDFENRYIGKNGKILWLSWRANFNKSEGITYATARDITDRKQAEEALRISEKRFRTIIEHAPDGFTLNNAEGFIQYASPAVEHILGYTPIEVTKGNPADLTHPDDLPTILALLKDLVQTPNKVATLQYRMRHKDGSWHWLESTISNMLAESGINAIVFNYRDVTERKNAEERIKELSELRSKFLNIMAHQLRTPLSSVNWNLEMLINGDLGKVEETQKKFLQVTYNESKKITNRIRDLLAAVDIEDQRVLIKKEDFQIDSLVSSIVGEIRERSALKGLKFIYKEPHEGLPSISGDGEKLRIVLSQLLENAVTYTPEGGEVSVTLSQKDKEIRFEVKDTGVGIPAGEQHRIHERFYRASNASVMHPDGFGLGLYVAWYFIQQHNGTIGFESKEGKGSTFWFEIPIKKIS
ncbi:MAG: PAS domain S-box protein [Candidatus Paceibacterota bacterium]|jgi:PAS domain S-box-containing protein